MSFKNKSILTLMTGLLLTSQINAATVTLKDGRSFEGQIKSQDAEKVVLDMNGIEMTLPVNQVSAIDMSDAAKEVAAEKEPTLGVATVAAGTALTVKMTDGFNSRQNKTGQRFAAVLEGNLMSGDTLVAPKGSNVYGVLTNVKKAGRLAGSAALSFELNEISINGTMFAIKTHNIGGEGVNTVRKTLGTTARAAAVGGLIDGSDGAKTGAKVGVGVSVLTKGNDIQVPKGELIEFILSAPFTPE